MIGRWFAFLAARAIVRAGARVLTWLTLAAIAVAAAPVSLVCAGAVAVAWWCGWQPRRLLAAVAWCGPMVAVWLAWTASSAGWMAAVSAPYRALADFWRLAGHGDLAGAAAAVAPAAIPVGLSAGALVWAYLTGSLAAGVGGLSPASAVAFDRRQWRHQARSARARIAMPGAVPLTMRGDLVVAGAVIRSVCHRAGILATVGYQRMRSHQVVVGTTGTGKTTLLLRLWAGFMATCLRRHAKGLGAPPLLVVLDCKGGSDARRIAERFGHVLKQAGATSTAAWPDEASLSLWALPPRQLTTTLVDLIEHGTGSAAYYADVMDAFVALAVEAPCGPPSSAKDLLARFEPGWLAAAYAGAGTAADHVLIRSASRHLTDVSLRLRTLFRRLGTGLDGPGTFGDADAWYCMLEGTDQIPVAEAQARALVDLLAHFAASGPSQREILLAVDEFSAVSRRLPIWQLCERARSLGLAVQVSAQSWQGLAATEDERYRIAASAEGGIWLLRTPHPEPLAALAGTRKVIDTTRQLGRFPAWRRRGSSRLVDAPVVDLTLIRSLDVGQAADIYRGGVTYVQVKQLDAGRGAARDDTKACPADLGAGANDAIADERPRQVQWPAALPDAAPVLDAAFGPEPRP